MVPLENVRTHLTWFYYKMFLFLIRISDAVSVLFVPLCQPSKLCAPTLCSWVFNRSTAIGFAEVFISKGINKSLVSSPTEEPTYLFHSAGLNILNWMPTIEIR